MNDTWLRELLAAIDAKDPDGFVSFLTDEAIFRYGSQEPVRGKPAVREYVAGFFGMVEALQHSVLRTWNGKDSLVCQGEVTYTKHGGEKVTVPFTNIFDLEGDKVRDYLIYVDPSPLMG
ncbi:MAG: nuclear transport factor 2 family protein [Gemmatimonadota bacterium]|nr:MAG: nuclear transport factor 2 family protein [Gemmatimonadota bacterium]